MSNNLEVSTDPTLLSVDLPSINASPSASSFLPAEASSTCLLLPNSPSPELTHPLTPSTAAEGSEPAENGIDGETNSSGSSSGLNIVIPATDTNHVGNGLTRRRKNHRKFGEEEKRATLIGDITITCTDELPTFVYWNWPFIRKCTFTVFICLNLGVLAFVVGMIANLPKTCNPTVPWYRGGVFYEIFPASFQDSNRDGIGDLRGIANRVNYLKNLGVQAVRLNSIYPATQYPEHYDDITTLFGIDAVLGDFNDFAVLVANLHKNNISLVLDVPLEPLVRRLDENTQANETTDNTQTIRDSLILNALEFWVERGVDGFYIKDLQHFHNDSSLVPALKAWQQVLGSDRCLIVSSELIRRETLAVLAHVDLVDVHLRVTSGAPSLVNQIEDAIRGPFGFESSAWIHWSIDGVDHHRMASTPSLAPLLMQLMLPGTPSIFYGNEVALDKAKDTEAEHIDTRHLHHVPMMEFKSSRGTERTIMPWIPPATSASFQHLAVVRELIELRKVSPAIYLKQVLTDGRSYQNTNLRSSKGDLIVIERHYPRRKNYGTFTNLGNTTVKADLSSVFYSGDVVVTSADTKNDTKIYFNDFKLGGMQTIIVKLDK